MQQPGILTGTEIRAYLSGPEKDHPNSGVVAMAMFGQRFHLGLVAAATMVVLSLPLNANGQDTAALLVIKFDSAEQHPANVAFVEKLSADAGHPLLYLHSLSGGAHVFAVQGIADTGQFQQVIERLSERADVTYVEQNRLVEPQGVY